MTSSHLLTALLPLVDDLARELDPAERYRRVLQALRAVAPADAAALLKLDGEYLLPLAVDGLSADTLGRRFEVAQHPRFARILSQREPTRFASDSPLPDPYDGLVDAVHGHLPVHDCLGCPLYIDERPWGVLTLDALDPARFDGLDPHVLSAFASLAAASVRAAQRIERLALRAEHYRAAHEERPMIGQSPALRRLQEEVGMVANSDLSVLITGETGTGKELVAQALHRQSARAGQPLVSLNCAALPDTLVESELFGHVRGAYTGASNDRRGKFELADGGTLFLDEVGELPLATQAKLLRVLQSGQLQRLGSDREHRVDVRLITATNRDLAEEVRAGRMRADFYHRLSVFPLQVPALRERGADVLLLAGYFLEQNRARLGLRGLRLATDAQQALLGHDWPGNVRELEHLLSRAVLRARARHGRAPGVVSLAAADLQLAAAPAATAVAPNAQAAPGLGLRAAVDDFQRQLIGHSLAEHGQHWPSVARALELDRANLNRLARRLGLK
ncbi:nitric oxide reductase transcriptional regulator NorR [Pseudomonas sp. NPDC007930]|uniref:nitric oxide reductase transcriptional regulator NorR n=1 Tax=Pseudomonas sp. NPDC007930 TaxID=3364417 RepID=UPI0036F0DD1E